MRQKRFTEFSTVIGLLAISVLPATAQCTLSCPTPTGTVGKPYSSSLGVTGQCPAPANEFEIAGGSCSPAGSCQFVAGSINDFEPVGLSVNQNTGAVTGTPTMPASSSVTWYAFNNATFPETFLASGTCSITITGPPPQACTTGPKSLSYNVSEGSRNASEIVWFNSHFKLQGNVPSSDFTVNVTNQSITFGPQTLTVPDATITFSSSVACASTSFNSSANEWVTVIPLSSATQADEIFSAGLAFVLPANFPQNVNNVTWNATFSSPTAQSLQFQFQYGAANYLSANSAGSFPLTSGGQPDYNAMMINPVHNAPTCAGYNRGDHAGTPENTEVKSLVTGGGSGGGGSNWTGSWSSTPTYVCATSQQPA